jgi:hypothetical protein
VLVLALVVLSLQLVSNPNVVRANSAHVAPEANSPSIPNYQWQFLSDQEKANVNASLRAIMNERFKNITLNIQENAGAPYTGKLQAMQTSTEFINWAQWAPISGLPNQGWNDYLAINPSHSQILFAKWSEVEAVRGQWNFNWPDQVYADSVNRGLTDFHIFLGPSVGECCYWIPEWAKTLEKSARSGNSSDYESLKSAMREYVETVVSHFKGRIQQYEIWWEANAWYGNDYWPLDGIIDIIKMEALTIRATDPSARIYVDLVRVAPDSIQYMNGKGTNNWTTEYFVQQLLAAGVPFDVLGLETHIGAGWIENAGDVNTLYNWLIELEKFGKPLYIWEDGLESYLPPDWLAQQQRYSGPGSLYPWVGTWHGTPSEEKQSEYMVAETLVYLGNPSVIGLHWLSLNDEFPWWRNLSDDGVLYANGTRKKSFYALEQLWNSLMVNETVQSVSGVATFRGLAGSYSISAEGYEPSSVYVSEGNPNTFSLSLRSLASRDQASQMLSKVGLNLTAISGGVAFQSPEAKNLLNQSLGEYRMGEQMFQSKNYTGALQHAQKALDLIQQAQTRENKYQEQQLLTRIAEIAVAVAVPVGCAVAAASYLRRKRAISKPTQPTKKAVSANAFCIECGRQLPLGSKFCNKCGTRQP